MPELMEQLIEQKQPAPKPAGNRNLGLGLVALAVVSSLLASTCCLLPLVLVLLGITGAWMTHLTSMQPITPVFTVLAVGALAAAAYLIFRPRQACSPAEAATCAMSRRSTTWIFFGSALFVGALLLFPLAAPYFY
jgi:mercuric ion transport protein